MTIVLNSCGVMFGGSKYQGTIIAKDHPNAEIYVKGQKLGNGQATALFPRDEELTVELREPGCETKTQTFAKAFQPQHHIDWGTTTICAACLKKLIGTPFVMILH